MTTAAIDAPSISDKLASMIEEANRLLSQRDGVHEMHGACAVVRGLCLLVEQGEQIHLERVENILARMRICVRTGFYLVGR